MENKRSQLVLAVLLCGVIASAARAQPALLPPPGPDLAVDSVPSQSAGKSPSTNEKAPPAKGKEPGDAQKDVSSPPDDAVVELKPPPLEAGDKRFPINLGAALRLADARPLVVTSAQASAWKAEAELQHAAIIWIPGLNLGADFIRHDGFGPDLNRGVNVPQGVGALGQPDPGSFGKPLNQNVNFLYAGSGVTFTPDTPNYLLSSQLGDPLLPSPQMQALTDIIFLPLYQRQRLNAERWSIQHGKNEAVRDTARAYFRVHRYRGQYAGALYCVELGQKLVDTIKDQSRDLVAAVEVDRARNILADLEQQAVVARQNWRVASADLTRVLRLDPRSVLEPMEHDHLQITLIDPSRSLDDLIPIGLTNRPELAEHQALVQATLVAIRREKLRPFLPSLLINGFQTPYELIEGGVLAEGRGSKLNLWNSRDDFSPQVLWQAENVGLGNLARIKRQRAEGSEALVRLFAVQDGVAGDVTRAQADVQAAAARVVQAEKELRSAIINYRGNVAGLKQTQRFGDVLVQIFRPQEVVFSLQLLKRGYDHYFETVAEYNTAQFELFYALGLPAQEIGCAQTPNEPLQVETERPDYLPAVGTGPPPATR